MIIIINNSEYFSTLTDLSGVNGGGFSLLAQFYTDFGWWTLLVMFILGAFIGRKIGNAGHVGFVSIRNSVGPLIFAAFLLSLRNDFAVFLKYTIQVLIISYFLNACIRTKIGKLNHTVSGY